MTVLRPLWWPRLSSAPTSRVYPPGRILRRHPDDELFHIDGDGRTPVRRRAEPSYLLAISSRYQRRIVSRVTRPANSPSRWRPTSRPLTVRRRR
jgi:hypothetical protein